MSPARPPSGAPGLTPAEVDAVKVEWRWVTADVSRHGQVRLYFRRGRAAKIRLPDDPKTPEFASAYRACIVGEAPKTRAEQAAAAGNSFRALVDAYLESPFYLGDGIGETTRARYKAVLLEVCEEAIAPGDPRRVGDLPARDVTAKAIKALRDRKAKASPHAANYRLKALRRLFRWAFETERLLGNPARDIDKTPAKTVGWHTWTVDEVAQYFARHPPPSAAHLALGLIMFTGARISDIVRMGQHSLKWGRDPDTGQPVRQIEFTPWKTRKIGTRVTVPLLGALERMIAACAPSSLIFLQTEAGRSFSPKAISMRVRKWCSQAGLDHCSAHGARKAAATIAAENGATTRQLQAIFGWSTAAQAEVYTRAADRVRLAAGADVLLIPRTEEARLIPFLQEQSGSKSVPPPAAIQKRWDNQPKKRK